MSSDSRPEEGTPAEPQAAPQAAPPATPPVAPPADVFRTSQSHTATRGLFWQILGELASARTAATLIALVGSVAWVASYYERDFGMEAVHVLIYQAWWFNLLFVFIAIAVVGAVAVRWPLRRAQFGFFIVHCGLVLLIAGFWVAGSKRLDGLLQAWPGEASSSLVLPTDELLVVEADGVSGTEKSPPWRSSFQTLEFAGYPSLPRYLLKPLWPVADPGIHTLRQPLELANLPSGTTVTAKRVVISGAAEPTWVAESNGRSSESSSSATHVALSIRPPLASAWQTLGDTWLTVDGTARSEIGPCATTLTRCVSPLLVDDFLRPADEAAPDGRLLIYWQGQRHELVITPSALPQQLELVGGSGEKMSVSIVRVITNPAHLDGTLQQEAGAQPNPLVEVELRQGSDAASARTLYVSAYSLLPPVPGMPEFLYSHPQLADPVGKGQGAYVQLLIGPDRRLHVRSFTRSAGAGPVATVDAAGWEGSIAGGTGKAMELRMRVEHLPAAVPSPAVLALRSDKLDRATRWLELEVAHGDARATCWIARGSRRSVTLPGWGEVLLGYQHALYDLQAQAGFAVRLDRFTVGKDPGGRGNASFASAVTVLPAGGQPLTADITMNEPLHYGGLTLYQTSFFAETDNDGQPTGRDVSVFTVAEDRGRVLKYLGSIVLVAGILTMYLMRRK